MKAFIESNLTKDRLRLLMKAFIESNLTKDRLRLLMKAFIESNLTKNRLRLLMKAFIESQFAYCPLVWMYHSRTMNNKINTLHERSLRLVYNDTKLSFQQLLIEDNSVCIHHRNLQKLATEMFKVKNQLSPKFMTKLFVQSNNPYNLRSNPGFITENIKTVTYGSETLSYRGPQLWNQIPPGINNSKTLI